MRTNEKVKKISLRRPDVRSIKIQPKTRDNPWSRTTFSEIKLSGNWLDQLGFNHGKRVAVTTMKELLIIRVMPD